MAADALGQPDAPERRRAPFAAGRVADLLAVGQAVAQIVQQEIGIGPDQLERRTPCPARRGASRISACGRRRSRDVEDLLALEHIRLVHVAARRHGEILRIEGNEIHDRRRRLDIRRAVPARRWAWPGTRSAHRCSRPNAAALRAWKCRCRRRRHPPIAGGSTASAPSSRSGRASIRRSCRRARCSAFRRCRRHPCRPDRRGPECRRDGSARQDRGRSSGALPAATASYQDAAGHRPDRLTE